MFNLSNIFKSKTSQQVEATSRKAKQTSKRELIGSFIEQHSNITVPDTRNKIIELEHKLHDHRFRSRNNIHSINRTKAEVSALYRIRQKQKNIVD